MKFVHMLAEIKEFKQSQEVAACLLTMRAEQQRLSTLENYLEDYQSEGLEKGISHQAEAVRTEHVFVQTLSHAVSEQSERLEALQGQNRTFYVGGATSFELIEPILEYSKQLVATHFASEA